MKSIFIASGIGSLFLGGAFLFGVIMSQPKTTIKEIPVEETRVFSHYVDKTGYYDTVVFTEEDIILSVY